MSDYPAELDVRPLTTWPGELTPAAKRRSAPFTAPLGSTLATLDRELFHLGAKHPVLEVAIPDDPALWRLDGRPRAHAYAEHPGVVLSLPTTNVGALRYATDVFTVWGDNLRAITLGLEALRKVERYGIVRRGEQYVGFRAITAGPATEQPMTVREAAEFVADRAYLDPDAVLKHWPYQGHYYRMAVRRCHPDTEAGTPELFRRLQEAKRILDEHAGVQ